MRATAANAARKPSSSAFCELDDAVMSTSVPSHGSARRARNGASPTGQRALMEQQQPAHTLGDVPARERRAGDVANIGVETHRVATALADELAAPGWKPNRVAVRLAIDEHLERLHRAPVIERQRISDELGAADDLVDDEPSQRARRAAHAPDAW